MLDRSKDPSEFFAEEKEMVGRPKTMDGALWLVRDLMDILLFQEVRLPDHKRQCTSSPGPTMTNTVADHTLH